MPQPTLLPRALRRCTFATTLALSALLLLVPPSHAQTRIPIEVSAALTRAQVPLDGVSFLVVDAQNNATPRLSHRANVAANPASLMKLVTTFSALELLGPNYAWRTPVYVDGTVRDGTLTGKLYIQGQGDPKLVIERLWLLLRRVQSLGIKTITGDIVLDRSAFETVLQDPGAFDGEPTRPYNAAPDALLINFKSIVMTFTPDKGANVARVNFDPPLAGVNMQASVPLINGPCSDYRSELKADISDPTRVRFGGRYPASCGERVWPLAYADPASYAVRAVEGMWREMGGQLSGRVVEGKVPTAISSQPPTFEASSPPLAEVIRDINKYSNNVQAQQVFLTLSQQQKGVGSLVASRDIVQSWWRERFGAQDVPVLDNGSGLSRSERISAQALARLLQAAWASPLMPELMTSLPITGVDGTLQRVRGKAALGNAHLKSGSLRNVVGVAGYVHAANGQRYVLVAIVNHANANAARPALDALIAWTVNE